MRARQDGSEPDGTRTRAYSDAKERRRGHHSSTARGVCGCVHVPPPAPQRRARQSALPCGTGARAYKHHYATRAQLSWPPDTLHARDTTANVRSRSRQPLRGESAALPCVLLCAVAARVSRRVCVHTHRTTAAAHSLAIGATFTSATWRDARDEKFHAKAARDDLFSLSRATPSHPSRSHPHKWRLPLCFVPQLRSTKRTCVILYHVWSTQHVAPRVGPARAIPAHGRTVLTASGVVVRSLILLGKKGRSNGRRTRAGNGHLGSTRSNGRRTRAGNGHIGSTRVNGRRTRTVG